MKELHLYLGDNFPNDTVTSFMTTHTRINQMNEQFDGGLLNTTQPSAITPLRFIEGWQCFVHFGKGNAAYEIKAENEVR